MKRVFFTLFALVFLLFPSTVMAAEALPDETTADVSMSDVSMTDAPAKPPVDFTPAEAIPSGVEVPYFYTKVESGMSLYIFMTADGTIHKRAYGSVNGVSGWYIAEGVNNYVYSETPDADLYADMRLYEASPWVYTGITTAKTHAGLLEPGKQVTSVDSIFGVEIGRIFKVLAVVTIGICLVIVISAGRNRREIARERARRNAMRGRRR